MNDNGKIPITPRILQSYYPVVEVLRDYLRKFLAIDHETGVGAASGSTVEVIAPEPQFLDSTYVATHAIAAVPCRPLVPVLDDMRHTIDRAQEKLFRKFNGRPSNLITSGYRLASKHGEQGKQGRLGISNYFTNTIVTALQGSEWECLLQHIGSDAMTHLLTETSIFIMLPNACLCQMAGEALIHLKPEKVVPRFASSVVGSGDDLKAESKPALKRKATEPVEEERHFKRARLQKSTSSVSCIQENVQSLTAAKPTKHAPADITLSRSRMFYGRTTTVPQSQRLAVGLHPKHILSRLRPNYHKPDKIPPNDYIDPDPEKQAQEARHLAKYVFARQYGFSSPFITGSTQEDGPIRKSNWFDREEEIKLRGIAKTPKRVKPVLNLLEKLLWRHQKCGYKPLRDLTCPSQLQAAGHAKIEESIILDIMLEQSSQLRTQAEDGNTSVDSIGQPILPLGLSQAEQHGKSKPRFAEFMCSQTQVFRYAVLVTKAVIPQPLWGSKENFKTVKKNIKLYISGRRYETLSLHNVVQGIKTSECEWLVPPHAGERGRIPLSDSLKRRELLEDFVFWFFDSFLCSLLKTTFYITESSAFRNAVLYFRQDDWQTLCAPLVEKLTAQRFIPVSKSEATEFIRQRRLGFSFVRLLPKETGVRPIVNLKRKAAHKSTGGGPDRSTNQILQAAFQVLSYERKFRPDLLGASVFGLNEVYAKLKDFKFRLIEQSNTKRLPKLFFVKLDVQACFDTIEQGKLLAIMRGILTQDDYMIQRYGQVSMAAGQIRRAYLRQAIPADDHPHFLQRAIAMAGTLRQTIFVDQVAYSFADRKNVLALLEEHITENMVKIEDRYYKQIVGIPQGSVLSALLCSFFYGDLERKEKFMNNPNNLLLRWIDDYLFVTPCLTEARRFLEVMARGHPEYGCFISRDKTQINFDYDAEIMNVTTPAQKVFPWCGFLINMRDLSITVDYTRFHSTYLRDSLTVERGRRPGAAFAQKMLYMAHHKSHILYCDTELNPERTVYFNLYQSFLLLAMKMHHYLVQWGPDGFRNMAFIQNVVGQIIEYSYASARSKVNMVVARHHSARCEISKSTVHWLGAHAFHSVLSRKPYRYQKVLKVLGGQLKTPRGLRLKRRYQSLLVEGLQLITTLSF